MLAAEEPLVEFDADEAKLSALVDRATVQAEAAIDPAVRRAFEQVRDELLPPGVAQPDR